MKNIIVFILNILIGFGCFITSILLIILTPLWFFINFIKWLFIRNYSLSELPDDYFNLWEELWVGDYLPRFYRKGE